MSIPKFFNLRTLVLIAFISVSILIGVKIGRLILLNNLEECGDSILLPLISGYSSNSVNLQMNGGTRLKIGQRYSFRFANTKITLGLLRIDGPNITIYYRNEAFYSGEGSDTPQVVTTVCKKRLNLNQYFKKHKARSPLMHQTISPEWDALFFMDYIPLDHTYNASAQTITALYIVLQQKNVPAPHKLEVFFERYSYQDRAHAYDAFLTYQKICSNQTKRINNLGLNSVIVEHLNGCGLFSCTYAALYKNYTIDLSVQASDNTDIYSLPSLEEMQTLVSIFEADTIRSVEEK